MQTIIVHGRVTSADDPMFRVGNDRVRKHMGLRELPDTVERWLNLGREITSIVPGPSTANLMDVAQARNIRMRDRVLS